MGPFGWPKSSKFFDEWMIHHVLYSLVDLLTGQFYLGPFSCYWFAGFRCDFGLFLWIIFPFWSDWLVESLDLFCCDNSLLFISPWIDQKMRDPMCPGSAVLDIGRALRPPLWGIHVLCNKACNALLNPGGQTLDGCRTVPDCAVSENCRNPCCIAATWSLSLPGEPSW